MNVKITPTPLQLMDIMRGQNITEMSDYKRMHYTLKFIESISPNSSEPSEVYEAIGKIKEVCKTTLEYIK